jgi:RNA recognition motif-containing protein
MANDEKGKEAIEALNGKEMDGRNITVNEARPRDDNRDRS